MTPAASTRESSRFFHSRAVPLTFKEIFSSCSSVLSSMARASAWTISRSVLTPGGGGTTGVDAPSQWFPYEPRRSSSSTSVVVGNTTVARRAVSVMNGSTTTTSSRVSSAFATVAESGSIETGLPAVIHTARTGGSCAARIASPRSGSGTRPRRGILQEGEVEGGLADGGERHATARNAEVSAHGAERVERPDDSRAVHPAAHSPADLDRAGPLRERGGEGVDLLGRDAGGGGPGGGAPGERERAERVEVVAVRGRGRVDRVLLEEVRRDAHREVEVAAGPSAR